MVCRRNDASVAQPDHAPFVMTDFGVVSMVRFKSVRLRVPVNHGMWVIAVGLVQMFARHRRSTDQPRHNGESDDGAPKPSRHNFIMSK